MWRKTKPMRRPYLNQQLRRLVAERANYACEYCLIHEQNTVLGCAVDHIISIKHGGKNDADNLAYACVFCNRFKGSDVGSIIFETRQLTRFYHPQWDIWNEHFKFKDNLIDPLTSIGIVTARILGFNEKNRLLERQLLMSKNCYLSPRRL